MSIFYDPFAPGGADETLSRDVLLNMLFLFVMLLLIMFVQERQENKKSAEGATAPGNVIVELVWDSNLNSDVDLWVIAPGDVPVGYSNKSGKIFSLLRDDLGRIMDITNVNMEFAYSRGMPPGEYVINVHLYRTNLAPLPIEATIQVRLTNTIGNPDGQMSQVASARVKLSTEGEEVTALRFRLDEKGSVVPGSIHNMPLPLRSVRQFKNEGGR